MIRPRAFLRRAALVTVAAAAALAGCDGARVGPSDGPEANPGAAADGPGARSPAPEDPASRALLDRIVRAETGLAYHGFRIASYGPPGASRESRLRVVGTAEGRTFVEWTPRGEETPRRKWSTTSRFAWVERPELLLRNYTVALDPEPSPPVAWRETRRVRVTGRRPGRPSMELLVDAEHWLVLAETCRTERGEEWLRGRFDAIEFGAPPTPPTPSTGDPAEELGTASAAAAPPAGMVPLAVVALPQGFERIGGRATECGAWVEEFSDGLAGLSVQQRPADDAAASDCEVRRSRWLGGLALTGRIGGLSVTVQGVLPDADLLAVFRSLGAAAPER